MKPLLRLVLIMLLGCCCSLAYADGLSSLTLTTAEMQKLKQYFPTEDNRPVVWQGNPLVVSLSLSKEKRLIFPSRVTIDVKGRLTTEQLGLVNNDQSIYLTALQSFPKTRIYVTLLASGTVILIDLMVDEHASGATQYIAIQKTNTAALDTPAIAVEQTAVSLVDVMRFAFQQVYAPSRLRSLAPAYTRAAMHTPPFVADLIYGDKVIAHPIASWVAGQRYVTVIALQNKYPHKTPLDIRADLCGDWQAAILYPRTTLLCHDEQRDDETLLFLVSQKPFSEVLGACHGATE